MIAKGCVPRISRRIMENILSLISVGFLNSKEFWNIVVLCRKTMVLLSIVRYRNRPLGPIIISVKIRPNRCHTHKREALFQSIVSWKIMLRKQPFRKCWTSIRRMNHLLTMRRENQAVKNVKWRQYWWTRRKSAATVLGYLLPSDVGRGQDK